MELTSSDCASFSFDPIDSRPLVDCCYLVLNLTMSKKEKEQPKEADKKLDLGLLEEDDEFEEFPADGELEHDNVQVMTESFGFRLARETRG